VFAAVVAGVLVAVLAVFFQKTRIGRAIWSSSSTVGSRRPRPAKPISVQGSSHR